jgi:DNA-binding FadR family transcriptional regulator
MKTVKKKPEDMLRDLLDSGRYQTQERLPPERVLADQFKIPRSALRRALEQMETEGRVWRHVGKGTFVGPRPERHQTVLSSVTALTNPTEIMEARLTLEPKLAALAALRISVNDIENLFIYLERSREVVGTSEYEQWDSMLHSTIAKAAGNALLFSLFEMVNNARNDALWGRLKEASLTSDRRRYYSKQHEELLHALKDRNAALAEELMRHHIETVKGHLLEIR